MDEKNQKIQQAQRAVVNLTSCLKKTQSSIERHSKHLAYNHIQSVYIRKALHDKQNILNQLSKNINNEIIKTSPAKKRKMENTENYIVFHLKQNQQNPVDIEVKQILDDLVSKLENNNRKRKFSFVPKKL